MKTKKDILKKYTGKGGILGGAISGIGAGVNAVGKGVKRGIQWAGNQVAKEMQMNKAKDNNYRREGENMMKGIEEYKPLKTMMPKKMMPTKLPAKAKILKDTIQKSY